MMDDQEILKLQQELEKSHEVLHKLINNLPGALYQYRLYPDGRATFPYLSNGIEDIYMKYLLLIYLMTRQYRLAGYMKMI